MTKQNRMKGCCCPVSLLNVYICLMQIFENVILFHWTNNGLYFPKILQLIWWKWWSYTNFCSQIQLSETNDSACDLRMFYQKLTAKKADSFERGNKHYRQICSRSCMLSLHCCTEVLVVNWANTKQWGLQPCKETLHIKYGTTANFGKKLIDSLDIMANLETRSKHWCGVTEKW